MGYRIPRMGWLPDPLDPRDLTVRDPDVARSLKFIMPQLAHKGARTGATASPVGPLRVDLRRWCSPVEAQGDIGSCTANAVVGAYEYFQRRMTGEHVDASRLFLYRATRRLLGWEGRGDTGAFIRATIRALRLFGVPPEEYWPYAENEFDREPEAFQYAFAQNFQAIKYFRLQETIGQLKSALDSGLPFAFGFTCFSSMFEAEVAKSGVIPYPTPEESEKGGHAVLAVGYTDSHVLIRNSWGEAWGFAGYGFLPWTYFDRNRPIATDCWALVNAATVPPEEAVSKARTEGLLDTARREQPFIQMVRGSDPVAEIPIRVTPDGVQPANDSLRIGLRSTRGNVSVELRSVNLTPSFDFTILGQATNELYLIGLVWDLSGRPPRLIPAVKSLDAEQFKGIFRQSGSAGEIRFADGGLQVWSDEPVVGALYLRLLIVESAAGAHEIGRMLRGAQDTVNQSELASTLAKFDSTANTEALTRAETASRVLADELTQIFRDSGNVLQLFKGVYGADSLIQGRTDAYAQFGAVIELKVALDDERRVAAASGLTALQQMQIAIAEEHQRSVSRGTEIAVSEPTTDSRTAEQEVASRKHTGPRA